MSYGWKRSPLLHETQRTRWRRALNFICMVLRSTLVMAAAFGPAVPPPPPPAPQTIEVKRDGDDDDEQP